MVSVLVLKCGLRLCRFWEIAIPVMAVVIPLFLFNDMKRIAHYMEKRLTRRKITKVCPSFPSSSIGVRRTDVTGVGVQARVNVCLFDCWMLNICYVCLMIPLYHHGACLKISGFCSACTVGLRPRRSNWVSSYLCYTSMVRFAVRAGVIATLLSV